MTERVSDAVLKSKVMLVEEADDRFPVYTLTFGLPEGAPESLGVRIDIGDVVKVMIPNYKPKSYSMSAARPEDREFDITYKLYPDGVCSGYLHSIQIGESMKCFGRASKQRVGGKFVGLVAYGVGITECLPVAAAELRKSDAKVVNLLWASKRYGDKFWLDQIHELKKANPSRFNFYTILSREEREGSLKGRVDQNVLQVAFLDSWGEEASQNKESCRFVSIGTKPMMADCYGHLVSLGFECSKDGGKNALFRKPDHM